MRDGKDILPFIRNISLQRVLNNVKREEVEKRMMELHGAKPGEPAYIGHLQALLKEMVDELDEDEREKLEEEQSKWNMTKPTKEVQSR